MAAALWNKHTFSFSLLHFVILMFAMNIYKCIATGKVQILRIANEKRLAWLSVYGEFLLKCFQFENLTSALVSIFERLICSNLFQD